MTAPEHAPPIYRRIVRVYEYQRLWQEATAERDRLAARVQELEAENALLRARHALCGCRSRCGDDGDIDGPGTCKGLPR